MTMFRLISLALTASLSLTGCGAINATRDIVSAVRGGTDLGAAIAAATANDTALALQEAQAIGDADAVPCLQKTNSIARMVEKDGPSPGIATDMERAIALKQIEIVCAGPMINSGKSLLLP